MVVAWDRMNISRPECCMASGGADGRRPASRRCRWPSCWTRPVVLLQVVLLPVVLLPVVWRRSGREGRRTEGGARVGGSRRRGAFVVRVDQVKLGVRTAAETRGKQ